MAGAHSLESYKVGWRSWLILGIVLFFGWGMYADYSQDVYAFFTGDKSGAISSAGSWGDTFGAFNGLVSLAGAVFVVRTLILQQKAIALQVADAHKQRFEATFFELLRLLRELRSELSFKHSNSYVNAVRDEEFRKERNGGDALGHFIAEQKLILSSLAPGVKNPTRPVLVESYEKAMTNSTERTFAPYFRIVYTILKKVHVDKVLTPDEKAAYSRLLRSQLTSIELMALAYNAMAPRSADLEDLLTEYRMLKYMPETETRKTFEGVFAKSAFLPRD